MKSSGGTAMGSVAIPWHLEGSSSPRPNRQGRCNPAAWRRESKHLIQVETCNMDNKKLDEHF